MSLARSRPDRGSPSSHRQAQGQRSDPSRELASLETALLQSSQQDAEDRKREQRRRERRAAEADRQRRRSLEASQVNAEQAELLRREQDKIRTEVARQSQQKRGMVERRRRAQAELKRAEASKRGQEKAAAVAEARVRRANMEEAERQRRERAWLAKSQRTDRFTEREKERMASERDSRRRAWEDSQAERRVAVLRRDTMTLTGRLSRENSQEQAQRGRADSRQEGRQRGERGTSRDTTELSNDINNSMHNTDSPRSTGAAPKQTVSPATDQGQQQRSETDLHLVLDADTLSELRRQFDGQLVKVLARGVQNEEARRLDTNRLEAIREEAQAELDDAVRVNADRKGPRKRLAAAEQNVTDKRRRDVAERKQELRQLLGFHKWYADRQAEVVLEEQQQQQQQQQQQGDRTHTF
jgi:hypothetical protein